MKTINRELSWLSFNERVLQEAMDENVPLVERIRFLGIYSNNLDEFFRVRVANVKRMISLKQKRIFGYEGTPEDLYKDIRKVVLKQQQKFELTYESLLTSLKQHNVYQLNEENSTESQKKIISSYFHSTFKHTLFPVILDRKSGFPELRDDAIYLAIKIAKKGLANQYALLQIPSKPSRFFMFNENGSSFFILADDIIRLHLEDIFSILSYDKIQAFTFKFTRDAELELDDDISETYSEKIERSLKLRKKGVPVRFVFDEQMPDDLLAYLLKCLGLKMGVNTIPGGRYHNFKDFLQFPDFHHPELLYKPQPPCVHPYLESAKQLLEAIYEKDVFLHFPYQKFDYIIDILREAAIDPLVTEIKINVYRVASNSQIMQALIAALYNRKTVVVVMELQARFDEKNNLHWSNVLKEQGAKVIFGVPNLKVHSKLLYINRVDKKVEKSIAYVGTGNFNEKSSKIYTDFALLTSNPKVVTEVNKVFRILENNMERVSFRTLMVSPFNFRRKLTQLIDKEIAAVKRGAPAYIKIKVNNLTDQLLIEKLIDASLSGVRVDMIVRGICCLKTDHKRNPNLTVISIVDRYLEHARMMVFCNLNDPLYYIASADLMERNIDQRIEVGTPIYDVEIQKELDLIFNYQWMGSVKSRLITSDMRNEYRKTEGAPFHAQLNLYLRYKNEVKD